jgi:Cu(I)/Ag(I) efflux system membrane fusion protein
MHMHGDSPGVPMLEHPMQDAEQQYVCPMHEEVVSDRPGTCPKCGMALQKTKGAQE